jgi:hypothetical protein
MEGLIMSMLYLSYTKITIFLEIIRFKLMYIDSSGFGSFGRFSRWSRSQVFTSQLPFWMISQYRFRLHAHACDLYNFFVAKVNGFQVLSRETTTGINHTIIRVQLNKYLNRSFTYQFCSCTWEADKEII